jgi:hypothetical protein
MLNLDALAERSQRFERCLTESVELGCKLWDWMECEKRGKARLDAVNGSDEEMAGAHREIDATEVEERFRRPCLLTLIQQRSEACKVTIECRLERMVEQVLDRERLREVATGRPASA